MGGRGEGGVDEEAEAMSPNAMTIPDAVQFYLDRGMRPIPMWGVTPDGRCLCGDRLRDGKPCNPGKHAVTDSEPWKDGRAYVPMEFHTDGNIAVALGPWNRAGWIVCLDFDGVPSRDYAMTLSRLDLPATLEQKSPRGVHLFYRVPEFTPLGCWNDALSTKRNQDWALDVRYARGKINVAPSRSAHGAYQWLDWRDPAPLPESVTERILSERRRRGLPVLRRWERERGKRP